MKNIEIKEKGLKSNPRRYLLVREDTYGREIIKPCVDDISEQGKMSLSTIDSITTKYWDKEQFLIDHMDDYDHTIPSRVYIEYKSNGENKQIPVMYNDKLLREIASNSTAKLWNDRKTRKLFTDMSFVYLRNDHNELKNMLDGESPVTEPHLRNVIGYGLNHGTHTMNVSFINEKLADYKQFRAVYYHTMYLPGQKVKKKM